MVESDWRVFWSDAAEDDLLSIWRYGADEWSPSAADDHLREIEDTTRLLLEMPDLGRSRDELIPGIRSIPIDPHVLFYRQAQRGIQVLRIVHQREDITTIFH